MRRLIDDELLELIYDTVLRRWIPALFAALAVAFVIVSLAKVVAIYQWHSEETDCRALHEQSGYPTRMVEYPLGGECYVQVGDRWLPADWYRTGNRGE
jgi:hypothetical protein